MKYQFSLNYELHVITRQNASFCFIFFFSVDVNKQYLYGIKSNINDHSYNGLARQIEDHVF